MAFKILASHTRVNQSSCTTLTRKGDVGMAFSGRRGRGRRSVWTQYILNSCKISMQVFLVNSFKADIGLGVLTQRGLLCEWAKDQGLKRVSGICLFSKLLGALSMIDHRCSS